MPVQLGGSKVADPSPKTDTTPRASSNKKNRRRVRKPSAAPPPPPSPMQSLFDTSRNVFANSSPGFVPPPEDVARLSALLNGLKPHDVGVHSSMQYFKHASSSDAAPPVTYLHFYDCHKFSFGIFCLPKSAVIPLHNHPGMTVFSKILFGSMHLKSYDWAKSPVDTDGNAPESSDAPENSDALVSSDGARLAKINTDAVFDASSETVVLYPENGGNLHCFTALTPCAVLDVMGPPYDAAAGRDCVYYDESPYSSSCGGDQQYSWLKEVVDSKFAMKGIQMRRGFLI